MKRGFDPANPARGPGRGLLALGIGLALACGITACASRESRHRVLNIFFDGVPPLESSSEAPSSGPSDETPVIEVAAVKTSLTVHGPYAARRCDDCHEPDSSNRLVVRRAELCLQCHDPAEFGLPVLHGPAASGQCESCHHPHRSELPNLLLRTAPDLCTGCHSTETFEELDEHRETLGADCLACHNPHGGQDRTMGR